MLVCQEGGWFTVSSEGVIPNQEKSESNCEFVAGQIPTVEGLKKNTNSSWFDLQSVGHTDSSQVAHLESGWLVCHSRKLRKRWKLFNRQDKTDSDNQSREN